MVHYKLFAAHQCTIPVFAVPTIALAVSALPEESIASLNFFFVTFH
jgi:hypothetical protein